MQTYNVRRLVQDLDTVLARNMEMSHLLVDHEEQVAYSASLIKRQQLKVCFAIGTVSCSVVL